MGNFLEGWIEGRKDGWMNGRMMVGWTSICINVQDLSFHKKLEVAGRRDGLLDLILGFHPLVFTANFYSNYIFFVLLYSLMEEKGEIQASATPQAPAQSIVLYWQQRWMKTQWMVLSWFEEFLTSVGGVGSPLKSRKMHTQFWLNFRRFLSPQNLIH